MRNKNFVRKKQAIYISPNKKSTRIIKTLMDFSLFIKIKIKMVCFSVPSFTPGSGEKVWWICNMNHRWQASIVSRTKGSKCPYCSGICVIRGKNDLATLRPDIAAEWNDEKNGELKPCNLKIKSNKKVWWKCKNGHEWQAIISNRTNKNQGCPFCKKR